MLHLGAQIGKRARGPSGRWERNRCAAPRRITTRGQKHSAEGCGLGLQLALAKANYADMDAAPKLEIGWDFKGGGRRLAIRGRWMEEPQGGGYDPKAP